MHEIAKVTLENEMDLILAHKRAMKLAEIAGLTLAAQTTFATAVSEISRNTLETGNSSIVSLGVLSNLRNYYIVACLKEEQQNPENSKAGLAFAKKLVTKYTVTVRGTETCTELFYLVPQLRFDHRKLDEWRALFRNEPPLSPYEELKRNNEQLQELSEKIQQSETQYKTLTNSLPLMIFTANATGDVLYANDWLTMYTGYNITELNTSSWQTVIHPADYAAFIQLLKSGVNNQAQVRLKNIATGEYLWHQVSLTPTRPGKPEQYTGYIVDIHAQKVYEATLKDNIELKNTQEELKNNQQVLEKYIEELNRSNYELQQFAYVASHDLQEPIRKILFYNSYLLNNPSGINNKGLNYLTQMQASSHRMRNLIQDLLTFSLINKEKVNFQPTDLNTVVNEVVQDMEVSISQKNATINTQSLPIVYGDAIMMRQLFGNLIGNSLKFSRPAISPIISISNQLINGNVEIIVKDNGIGFDDKYLPQMFTLFKRLHSRETYEGTGLGLAICRKIVDLHQGKIWAEGKEGEGATFHISLPVIT